MASWVNCPRVRRGRPELNAACISDRLAGGNRRQDTDLAPLLKGLPGDSCQCPHWGYVTAGRLTVRYADHEEVVEADDAFSMPPGHVPAAEAGTEFVMFSPTPELRVSEKRPATD